MVRFGEGHEYLMRQAVADFEAHDGKLPPEVNPDWLTLGNVRTDIANIQLDKLVSAQAVIIMAARGVTCKYGEHASHAMRCRKQKVAEAYPHLRETIRRGFAKGCESSLSWEERALAFGSALHTLQDSYCTAHAGRIDNGVPTSPIIAMYTYPSKQHPITTRRDDVWQDADHTAFKPEAAASIVATVAALQIFASQSAEGIETFLDRYVAFREDIAETLNPV
ncbi:MAG: hypothetical protein HY862_18820 [Chloroflexi bacterium]|nr:hypothetical protein [Chloroflexota bacterium]